MKKKARMLQPQLIARAVCKWYSTHGRKFPWRKTKGYDPYKILVTEMLLQRTKSETVAKIWNTFFRFFPTAADLANAPKNKLLKVIGKLGLKYRAERLVRISRQLVKNYRGRVPTTFGELLKLRGVGPYIASAVLCFAYGTPTPVVDSNIMRLMNRLTGFTDEKTIREYLFPIITTANPRKFNWGLIDLSTLICKQAEPLCPRCPLSFMCRGLHYKKDDGEF